MGEGGGRRLVQLHYQAPAGPLRAVLGGGKAGELHDPGRGEPEPVREAEQVTRQ
jgi:hypothetical protein